MELKESELDIIVAALHYASIVRNSFMEHLVEQGQFETAMSVRHDLYDLVLTCSQELNEVRNG